MSVPNIIFDTDMGNDVDDALAQLLLHSFVQSGDAEFCAEVVNKGNRLAPAFVDMLNRFYGRNDIDVGWCADGPTPEEGRFLRSVLEKGRGLLPYAPDLKEWPDAVSLLRRHLTVIPDQSGVYVSIGFSTILARLLESAPDEYSDLNGIELVARKLNFISIMAGNFDPGVMKNPCPENVEANIRHDISSAARAFRLCPVPMVFSGFEVGSQCCFPREAVKYEMDWCSFHPVKRAYELYNGIEHDRPLWDLTSLLVAVFPDKGYFGLSEPGTVVVQDDGHVLFEPSPDGLHQYLILDPEKIPELVEIFRDRCTQPFGEAKDVCSGI